MWKLLIVLTAVVVLAAFGDRSFEVPHIPVAVMVLPAVVTIFATGLFLSQR